MEIPRSATARRQRVAIGVSGWRHESWRELLEQSGSGLDDILTTLQWLFEVIEIADSYYHPPAVATVERWLRGLDQQAAVRFSVKLWQKFVREPGALSSPGDVRLFKSVLLPLQAANRLAAVVAQFPIAFEARSKHEAWLAALYDNFADYPLVLELLHPSWQKSAFLRDLCQRGVSIAHLEQPGMAAAFQPHDWSMPVGYLRCSGENRVHWFDLNASRDQRFEYFYSDDEIRGLTAKVNAISNKSLSCYVIFNNYPKGFALRNAVQLRQTFTELPVSAPAQLLHQLVAGTG